MGKDYFAPHTARFADLPHAPCVYAAELSGGLVKVGAASSARGRMMSLAAEVKRVLGVELGRFHVVVKPTEKAAFEAETTLVKELDRMAERLPGKREVYVGADYELACQLASTVVGTPYRRPQKVS